MRANDLLSILKKYGWLLVLGVVVGVSVALDPFLRYEYYYELEDTVLRNLFLFPYQPTLIFLLLLFVLTLLYHRLKTFTRLQWDLLLFFLLVSSAFINYWGLIHVHVTFILVSTGFFILFSRGALVGRLDIHKLPIDTYFLFMLFFMVVSIYGPLASASKTLGNIQRFMTGMFFPVIFIHTIIRTRSQMMKAIHFLIYLSIFSSLIGIGQFLAYKILAIDITGNWNVEMGKRVYLPGLGTFLRVAGLTGNSNYLGLSTGTITALMTFLLFKPQYFSKKWKRIFMVGVLVGLMCTVLTASRGSWLSLIVCYTVIPFIAYPKRKPLFLIILVSVGMFGLYSGLFEYLYDLVYEMRSQAIYYRERLLVIGLDCIGNYPWTGAGFGAFKEYWNFHDGGVHNLWLNFAAEIGVLGALVLVLYYFSAFFRLVRAILHSRGFNRVLLQAFLVSLIFFCVTSVVRPMIWGKFYWLYLGFVESAIYVLGGLRKKSKIYYPIFGYSWKDEPSIQLEGKL